MAKRKKKGGVPASMRGELPGEYKKISLVEVPMPMGSPQSIEAQRDRYGYLDPNVIGRQPTERYIVDTRRLDGQWSVEVEYEGERWVLPHKVVEQIRRHCDAIIKAQRSDKARDAAIERMENGFVPFQVVGGGQG